MFKTFFKIASLSLEYRWWMILAALMSFFTVGSGIGLMMTSSYIIASAALQTPIFQLQVAIVGVRFFGIARGVFRYLDRYISHEVTFKILAKLRLWFFKSLIPIIPSKKKDLTSGDLLSRSIEDIESLEHIFVRVISPPFVLVTISILMFYLLNLFSLKYSLVFILIYYTSAIGIPLFTFLISKKIGEKIVELKSILKSQAVDYVQGISELIFYNKTKKWINDFNYLNEELLKAEKKMSLIQSLNEVLTGIAMNITILILLVIAIPDVNNKTLNGVYLSVITIGIMASFEIVFQIPLAFQFLGKSIEAGKRLINIVEGYDVITEINLVDKNNFTNSIEFKNVSFSYDENKYVLKNLSFVINKNEVVAITGKSGVGKTSIVNLLTKLWQDYQGEILIDDINLKQLKEESIRNLIAVVPQNVHLFTGTIKENLLIAKSNATDDEIIYSLKQAELINFISNLPDGLNTNIGELGTKLSGGEAKRLAIARAILKNSPIIIFDEATSHLDYETENKILENLIKMKNEKTLVFITHRTNNIQIFDKEIKIV